MIISFDLQLYANCIQLQQSRTEAFKDFVFRMGELHVVFCALKTIGKCIDGSGLDMSLVQAGIYGPTTVEQIRTGKHRSFEGHLTLYLVLYREYLENILEENPLIEGDLRRGIIEGIVSLYGCRSM